MLNQIILVGRLKEMSEIKETENGVKYMKIILQVERPYKNAEGIYDKDNIECTLWRGLAESFQGVCQEGSVVGVKARIQSYAYENEKMETHYKYDIIVEKASIIQVNE